ncbi:MAG: hypothetical protein ACR2OC_12375, partial [Solirubrobacterales bacterium]
SGFLVTVPGLIAALRRSWSALFCLAAAASLIATGVWALIDAHAAGGLFYFPNAAADATLHFATSTIFLAGAAQYYTGLRAGRGMTAAPR